MNEIITYIVLQAALNSGVREFIMCAGSRNSSFVQAFRHEPSIKTYYWPEERSGAFFALGRARNTSRPVAVITTSGTAVGELLPAAMEAYYTGVPLLFITADRPPEFRDSGAPQSCEQPYIFGVYAEFFQDITDDGPCNLDLWNQKGPAHLNVCLQESQIQPAFVGQHLTLGECKASGSAVYEKASHEVLRDFMDATKYPFVIVSTLQPSEREATVQFLLKLGAPVMLEAISGLREDPRLQDLRIKATDKIFETAELSDYPIDGVLRIGGIPTHRIWRDIEYKADTIRVCSISEQPFSGLSWNRDVVCCQIGPFLTDFHLDSKLNRDQASGWFDVDARLHEKLLELFDELPNAETSLIYALSKEIANDSFLFLGNSLPIREWDLAATNTCRNIEVKATRGLNGIDGQISTFLGLCKPEIANYGVFGDLTTLYDLVGPWILPQLGNIQATLIVINNGGGKIFERIFPFQEMQNLHELNFEPFAKMWGMGYQKIESSDGLKIASERGIQLIEIVPDNEATQLFWKRMAANWKEVVAKAQSAAAL